jgi:hypothetical protein
VRREFSFVVQVLHFDRTKNLTVAQLKIRQMSNKHSQILEITCIYHARKFQIQIRSTDRESKKINLTMNSNKFKSRGKSTRLVVFTTDLSLLSLKLYIKFGFEILWHGKSMLHER